MFQRIYWQFQWKVLETYLFIVKQSLMDDMANAAQHQLLHLQKPFLHHTLKDTIDFWVHVNHFMILLSTNYAANNKPVNLCL